MSDKPHRCLQIHLSTAMVMMFVLSGLIWIIVSTTLSVRSAAADFAFEVFDNGVRVMIHIPPSFWEAFERQQPTNGIACLVLIWHGV